LREFSKPSAWAKRDQQYALDKQRWEHEARTFHQRISALKAENQLFREANKTAEYEARIAELRERIQQLEDEKDAALHQVHELKLHLAPVSGTFVSENAKADRCG
jgi:chromosome segregation ATPase